MCVTHFCELFISCLARFSLEEGLGMLPGTTGTRARTEWTLIYRPDWKGFLVEVHAGFS